MTANQITRKTKIEKTIYSQNYTYLKLNKIKYEKLVKSYAEDFNPKARINFECFKKPK